MAPNSGVGIGVLQDSSASAKERARFVAYDVVPACVAPFRILVSS
jgi:hypothetical protein